MATQGSAGAEGGRGRRRADDDRARHDPRARGAGRRPAWRPATSGPAWSPSGPSSSSASRSTARSRSGPASPTRSRPPRRPTRSATSSDADWGPESARFDLWMPTASPMTTPGAARRRRPRGRGARHRHHLGRRARRALRATTRASYPYAEDGRIPAPPGSGLLEPLVTLTYLAARTSTVRLGTAMLLLPQRNPVYVAKEVSTLDWLSGGRRRPRHRRRLAEGGVRRAQRALGAPGQAHRRVPRGAAHAVGRRHVRVPRRDLRPRTPARCSPSPCSSPPADPHRRRDHGRAPPGRPPRPGLAHLQPLTRGAGRRAGRARHRARGGRARPAATCASRCARTSTRSRPNGSRGTPRPVPTRWPRCSSRSRADDVARAFDDLEACRDRWRGSAPAPEPDAIHGRREVRSLLGAEQDRFLASPVGVAMLTVRRRARRLNRPQG